MSERIRYWEYKTIWSDVDNNHDYTIQYMTTADMLNYFRIMFRLHSKELTRIILIDDEGNTYRICGVKD